MNKIVILFAIACLFSSCGQSKVEILEGQVAQLQSQLDHQQESNSSLLDRMEDLSVINKTESKSIQSSLQSLNRQNEFIMDLTDKIHEKDSVNFALVTNLKRSLLDINDEDIQVEVKGSAVYVTISDQLLFKSASAQISRNANIVLQKVATVINDHEQINALIEGHTDNVPINNNRFKDNWDLSVQRATSVVRILQQEYGVDPMRITAAGRAHFVPKAENDTPEGRSTNRRTEIILTPKLNQFFDLLEAPDLAG